MNRGGLPSALAGPDREQRGEAGHARIVLHHFSLLDAEAHDVVHAAGANDVDHVCLFVQGADFFRFPLVEPGDTPELRRLMDDNGVTAYNVEAFFLLPDTNVVDYRQTPETGAMLGGTRATALHHDHEEQRFIDNLGRLCDIAAVGRPNVSVALDMLHMARAGMTPAQLAAADPALAGYVQLCDGNAMPPTSDYVDEALNNRTPPGEGARTPALRSCRSRQPSGCADVGTRLGSCHGKETGARG